VTGSKRISEKTLYFKKYEMIATIVMTGSWQELPIDIGTDIEKLSDRFTPNDKITNSF
jgi:hypothetical protein